MRVAAAALLLAACLAPGAALAQGTAPAPPTSGAPFTFTVPGSRVVVRPASAKRSNAAGAHGSPRRWAWVTSVRRYGGSARSRTGCISVPAASFTSS